MKKNFLICMLLFTAACGFRPMFSGQDNDIYVSRIDGINGIELRNALNARFGGQRGRDAEYTLNVILKNPTTEYKALAPTGDASWQQIILKADYTLFRNGEEVASGAESASESYTFVRYLVAANASYDNAVSNTINVLAGKISARVIAETDKIAANKKAAK